jgi:glycine/D-amino acid oxidase-like deaminating enzyme
MNFAIPPADKKKVLIVGGGVSGMQAALTCAERGHDVICAKKRTGSAVRCAARSMCRLRRNWTIT